MVSVTKEDIEKFITDAANDKISWNVAINFLTKMKRLPVEEFSGHVAPFDKKQKQFISATLKLMRDKPDLSRQDAMKQLNITDFNWSGINIVAKQSYLSQK